MLLSICGCSSSAAAPSQQQVERIQEKAKSSKQGSCWHNAAVASFISSLKTERIHRHIYRNRGEAHSDVFNYIERFYNPRRRHSTLGYLSPMDYEKQAILA